MEPVTHLKLVPKSYVSVKELAAKYGLSRSTLYELIKSDPNFPYKNIGLRKKFVIDAAKFEIWIEARTEKHKNDHFNLPTASGLLEKYRK